MPTTHCCSNAPGLRHYATQNFEGWLVKIKYSTTKCCVTFDFPWFQFLKMLKPKNCQLKNQRTWDFGYFQNSKTLQIPWKNQQRIVGSWQFFDYFYLKLINGGYIRTGSLILWGSSCEIQATAVLITTRVLVPFLIPTHLLVRTYMVFHLYSTSFARFYVIVTWGVMILHSF
jgi:hypothetical protein